MLRYSDTKLTLSFFDTHKLHIVFALCQTLASQRALCVVGLEPNWIQSFLPSFWEHPKQKRRARCVPVPALLFENRQTGATLWLMALNSQYQTRHTHNKQWRASTFQISTTNLNAAKIILWLFPFQLLIRRHIFNFQHQQHTAEVTLISISNMAITEITHTYPNLMNPLKHII